MAMTEDEKSARFGKILGWSVLLLWILLFALTAWLPHKPKRLYVIEANGSQLIWRDRVTGKEYISGDRVGDPKTPL